eukprot:CAMPEP_0182901546 /NCGR_PEP_ID=MMETSP0034_2-20130328/29735_1 /TAXON_ID=156128 /ORGANISM="Nephroselmis pyriformis, Strain CCMP717" /LENGTH=296 /DNA_ID=CAMNT_0025035987 /DNA_START=84 /DNA_END=972 /DNA_ORIENTATION=-
MAGGLRHRATHAAASKGSHALTNEWRDEYTITAVDGEQFADPAGRVVGKYLRSEGAGDGEALRTVAADVALELMDNEGYRLLDPRIQWSYDEWHIEDPRVEHIPYHREIKGNSPAQLYRKVGFAIFVENPPFEQVPDFLNQVRLKFNEDDKILVACDCGGRIIRCEDDEYEVNNRDIIATSHDIIFLLRKTGFKNVVHVAGGFCSWRKTPALVERTPGVTVNYPWEKTGPLREFFPKPCEWSYVYACDPNSALPIEECGCECGDMTGPNFDPTRARRASISQTEGKGRGRVRSDGN